VYNVLSGAVIGFLGDVAELAYAGDLKSSTFGFVGSIPTVPIKQVYIRLRSIITKESLMVEKTVNNEEQAQEQYRFENPIEEFQRAKSDYLYVSKNYENYYGVSGYIQAEEKAWERLDKAFKNLQNVDPE
jgi:hypothetical protein